MLNEACNYKGALYIHMYANSLLGGKGGMSAHDCPKPAGLHFHGSQSRAAILEQESMCVFYVVIFAYVRAFLYVHTLRVHTAK